VAVDRYNPRSVRENERFCLRHAQRQTKSRNKSGGTGNTQKALSIIEQTAGNKNALI
jgi:hypothetical protein